MRENFTFSHLLREKIKMAIKMITVVAVFLVAIQSCLGFHQCSTGIQNPPYPPDHCLPGDVTRIPYGHIYRRLRSRRRPLVIGHRGNVQVAQENSFDSVKGVLRHGADGFEVDVFMTADGELVCFHDQNTLRLTGESHDIESITKATINGLRYQKTIQYGTQQKTYSKRRKIAFLDQVLGWARNKRLLVYIEMKPEPTLDPAARPAQIARSAVMGQKVAQLVKRKRMLKQVIVNSFDVTKSFFAKQNVTQLVIGTSWTPAYWFLGPAVHELQKQELMFLFNNLIPCLFNIPTTNNVFIDFLFQSGTVEKQIGAAFVDLEFSMFNNSFFGGATHTMCMLKKNYGRHAVVGAYTLHDLSKTAAQIANETPVYVNLLRDRVDLFYTDNICDMVQLVEDTLRHPYGRRRRSASPSHSSHRYRWRRSRHCNRSY